MGTISKLNEYAEMQEIKDDLNKIRKDCRRKWDKSQDMTSGKLLLSTIRARITVGRFELQSHIKTGNPPKVGLLEK